MCRTRQLSLQEEGPSVEAGAVKVSLRCIGCTVETYPRGVSRKTFVPGGFMKCSVSGASCPQVTSSDVWCSERSLRLSQQARNHDNEEEIHLVLAGGSRVDGRIFSLLQKPESMLWLHGPAFSSALECCSKRSFIHNTTVHIQRAVQCVPLPFRLSSFSQSAGQKGIGVDGVRFHQGDIICVTMFDSVMECCRSSGILLGVENMRTIS